MDLKMLLASGEVYFFESDKKSGVADDSIDLGGAAAFITRLKENFLNREAELAAPPDDDDVSVSFEVESFQLIAMEALLEGEKVHVVPLGKVVHDLVEEGLDFWL